MHRRISIIAGVLTASGAAPGAADFTFNFTLGTMPSGSSHSGGGFTTVLDGSGNVVWGPMNTMPYSEQLDGAGLSPWTPLTDVIMTAAGPAGDLPPGISASWRMADPDDAVVDRRGTRQDPASLFAADHPFHAGIYAAPGDNASTLDSSKSFGWRDYRADPSAINTQVTLYPAPSISNPGVDDEAAVLVADTNWYDVSYTNNLNADSNGQHSSGFYVQSYSTYAADGGSTYLAGARLSWAPNLNPAWYKETIDANPVFGPSISTKGLQVQRAATQHIANGKDLSDWTDANSIIQGSRPIGVMGHTNDLGSTLTSSGADQLIEITPTIASTELTFACWVKGGTINGDVFFSPDGGTTQIAITPYLLSGDWELFEHTFTGANPNLEIRIVTSGDSFDIDCVTLAEEPFAQMPIPTAGTASARGEDTLTITGLLNITTYDIDLTSTQLDGSDSYVERAQITSDGSGEYVFSWDDFPASDIREHRIVRLLEFYEV